MKARHIDMTEQRRKQSERTPGTAPRAATARANRRFRAVGFGAGGVSVMLIGIVILIWRSDRPRPLEQDPGAETESVNSTNQPSDISSSDDSAALSDTIQVTPSPTAEWNQWDNPSGDGWATEAFHQRAKKQLAVFAELMSRAHDVIPSEKLDQLLANDFQCYELVPEQIEAAEHSEYVTVAQKTDRIVPRTTADEELDQNGSGTSGVAGLARAWKRLSSSYRRDSAVEIHFKIFRVFADQGKFSTMQSLEMSGQTDDGALEQHATWRIDWDTSSADSPRLRFIKCEEFEQVTLNRAPPLFADCTESVLGRTGSYRHQLLRGYDHWLQRMQEFRYWFVLGTPGIAVGDVNGDGLEDLYLCQEEGLPNRLFLQEPDGSVREVAASWRVDWLQWSRSALLVDFDNDGDCDLAVAITGGVVLAENQAGESFRVQQVLPTADDTTSLSAADFDQDGRLDLYVSAYYANRRPNDVSKTAMATGSRDFVIHDANTGGRNSLFRNRIETDQSWVFTDVTEDVGLNVHNRRFSLAAAWEDYDNDGDQDLYVANDFGVNCLYRNQVAEDGRRQFEEVSAATGAEDRANGMSVAWGDYNRDGWMDIYISNMYSAAGNRVADQQGFGPHASAEVRQRLRRFAEGNTMLAGRGSAENPSSARFEDVTSREGASMGRWAWASRFADIDNDGWLDLFVANGYITAADEGDL